MSQHAKPEYLSEWEYFVYRHQSVVNIIFHHLSLIGPVIAFTMFCVSGFDFRWFILTALTWPLGTLGHYVTSDGTVRGVDFIRWQTLESLFRITSHMIKGDYSSVVQGVTDKVEANGGYDFEEKKFFTIK